MYTWERRYNNEWAVVGGYNSTTHTTSSFGQYRCKVHNTTTMTVSEVAVVIVQSQDTLNIIDSPLKRGVLKRGNFYTLTCNASGPGTVTYSWEKDTIIYGPLLVHMKHHTMYHPLVSTDVE